ncbi:SH3 domain-containing protein [Aeromonas caviae]|uniref:SH3 domain-containing protein n=1 Tax=Aeromonas caviae TaxID=648 RepID=UPI0029D8EC6B|nr:SH3 domain-containing protein [Aeromonas caviae]MDX7872694.1 SH3 domain-containing protein [Aeromonas caviae]
MKENRKLNHLHIQIPHELTALKISKEMVQPFSILESPAMKVTRELAQSLAFQDSAAMKVTRELAQSLAFQDSAAMKVTRELAQSLAFQDSAAMKVTRELAQSLAFQNSAAMKVAREVAQSFALQESAAMKAVREMTLLFATQDSVVIAEHINKLLTESSDGIEVKNDVVEQTVVNLTQVTSSDNNGIFLSWYDNQSSSVQLIVTLILSYFLNVFSNLSMPLYENWEYLFQRETPRVATKLVSQTANKGYEIDELSHYRFVVASVLNIRDEPSIKSEVIDELKNGMVVKFIAKSKRWTHIEYLCNETGERKTGWVFSRYLRKFDIKTRI